MGTLNQECCVCYSTVDLTTCGEGITTNCNHVFHNTCLAKWLLTQNSCPLCRTDLCLSDQSYNTEQHNDPDEVQPYLQFGGQERVSWSLNELQVVENVAALVAADIQEDNEQWHNIPWRCIQKLRPVHTRNHITSMKVDRTGNSFCLQVEKKEKTSAPRISKPPKIWTSGRIFKHRFGRSQAMRNYRN